MKFLGVGKGIQKMLRTDGTRDKLKAKDVVFGFKKKNGVEYFDTYYLVIKVATVDRLISIGSIHNLIVHRMDVKITFLKVKLWNRHI